MNRLLHSVIVLFAMTLLLTPAFAAESTADKNKAITRQFYEEVFNKGNLDQIDKYVAADAADHQTMPGKKDPQPCRDNIKEYLSVMRKAFPDLKVKIEDLLVDGDKVVARCTLTGTQKGEFMGTPATGKTFSVQIIDIIRFKDGKCVEHWGVSDDAGMMQQLSGPASK